MKQLERERESVDADKAQVDRYKKLLIKQRDIMIALTARLNERDEQILSLQVQKYLPDVGDYGSVGRIGCCGTAAQKVRGCIGCKVQSVAEIEKSSCPTN